MISLFLLKKHDFLTQDKFFLTDKGGDKEIQSIICIYEEYEK